MTTFRPTVFAGRPVMFLSLFPLLAACNASQDANSDPPPDDGSDQVTPAQSFAIRRNVSDYFLISDSLTNARLMSSVGTIDDSGFLVLSGEEIVDGSNAIALRVLDVVQGARGVHTIDVMVDNVLAARQEPGAVSEAGACFL
ncbi:MAG: hypothetical protein K0U36_00075 [Alphaproteobacteria bacterium]|nr:hypothetical protein [Alphaproteobacteria bacterium]